MRAVDLARELGIKDSTLRRWAQEYEEMGENAFPGNGSPKVNKDYEIVRLRKRIEEHGREPRGQGVRRRSPQQAMGGRHRLHRNGRRMALPRSRDRRVPREGRGPVDVRAHDREAGRGCARAGGRRGEPALRLQPRLSRRPGFPVSFPGVPALPRIPWNRPIHVAAGQPMGQRARGILLQDAQARVGERQGLQDEGGGEAGRAQIHRALLQQAEDALIDRL